jgi:hypothetical protein
LRLDPGEIIMGGGGWELEPPERGELERGFIRLMNVY